MTLYVPSKVAKIGPRGTLSWPRRPANPWLVRAEGVGQKGGQRIWLHHRRAGTRATIGFFPKHLQPSRDQGARRMLRGAGDVVFGVEKRMPFTRGDRSPTLAGSPVPTREIGILNAPPPWTIRTLDFRSVRSSVLFIACPCPLRAACDTSGLAAVDREPKPFVASSTVEVPRMSPADFQMASARSRRSCEEEM